MKRLIPLLVVLLIAVTVSGRTLGELNSIFRYTVNEIDTAMAPFPDSASHIWANLAQRIVANIDGNLEKDTTIIVSTIALRYNLPSDFQSAIGVMIWDGTQWHSMHLNPMFANDSREYQYDVRWKNADTARLYIKGDKLFDGMTTSVFYKATPSWMDSTADTIDLAGRLEPFVIEEMIGFYYRYKEALSNAQFQFNRVRNDMGIKNQEQAAP